MTCIVAVVSKDGDVHFGCDSLGSDGHSQTVLSDPKIYRNGEILIGFTGSFRMGQILQHSFSLPERMERQKTMDYLCNSFVEAVKISFKMAGFGYHGTDDYIDKEDAGDVGGLFMIGYRKEIYIVQEDYAILHAVDDFAAIGSGGEPANAVLYATRAMDMDPKKRLQLALEAASYQISSVKPPFHYLSISADLHKKKITKKKVSKKKIKKKE